MLMGGKMNNWIEGPFVALDFETTGVDTKIARPVEVAILLIDGGGKILEEVHTLVKTGEIIPEEASNVHGITKDKCENEGKDWKSLIVGMNKLMKEYTLNGLPIIIYNVPYDWSLFIAETERAVEVVDYTPNFIDPLCLDRKINKYRKGGTVKVTDIRGRAGPRSCVP